jgi:hypothetical protein
MEGENKMPKEFTEKIARAVISRNRGSFKGKQIVIARAGLKVLSAIDYLSSEHGYVWMPRDGNKT